MYRTKKGILHEVSPIMESNIIYIVDRKNKVFDFPIHTHEVFELNFLENAPGVKRIVGDSEEVIGDRDLVLITNENLEHIWEKNEYTGTDAREVTIQFDMHFEEDSVFRAAPFKAIRQMILNARRGLVFSQEAINKVYSKLDKIGEISDGYYAITGLLDILYELSRCVGARQLASYEYVNDSLTDDNYRMAGIRNYIQEHFRETITLPEIARLSGMSISSFGRFFKLHMGKTLSEYIISLRINYATTQLVETEANISEISFSCGFNNLSHFNRLFKRAKGCSPSQFRETYRLRQELDAGLPVKTF